MTACTCGWSGELLIMGKRRYCRGCSCAYVEVSNVKPKTDQAENDTSVEITVIRSGASSKAHEAQARAGVQAGCGLDAEKEGPR